MKPQIIKESEKNRILERIRSLAKSYTPDWNPDFNEPDFGSALALIFKDMYLEQVQRLNQLPNKQRRDLINLFNPVPHGPVASRGFVCFELSEGASNGVFLDSGFQLLAEGNEDTELHFETTQPLYVTHSKMDQAFVYDHEYGWFSKHTGRDDGLEFPLFHVDYKDNVNRPSITIRDPKWLYLRPGMSLGLNFTTSHDLDKDRLIEGLCDPQKAQFIVRVEADEDQKQLKIQRHLDGLYINLTDDIRLSGAIECHIMDIAYFRDIEIQDLCFQLTMDNLDPQVILCNEDLIDSRDQIYPFSKNYNVFDAFYIGDDDAFSKPGALVQIEMKLMHHLIPIEELTEEENIRWRNIMRESELREPEPRTIRVENLLWEYWNGIGWTPLKVPAQAYTIPDEGLWHIEFICPDDMEAAVFGPAQSTYIRARINKVQNAFAPKGHRAVPLIQSIKLRCNTKEQTHKLIQRPQTLETVSNLECQVFNRDQVGQVGIAIARSPDENIQKAVYLSLSAPLDKGPLRIEVEPILSSMQNSSVAHKIQYYGIVGGRPGWYDLPHEDETDGFIMNGLVSFMAPKAMVSIKRFNHLAYWLRLLPMDGLEGLSTPRVYTRQLQMRLNGVRVEQTETLTPEFFTLGTIQPHSKIYLSRAPVLQADVWINEIDSMNEKEIAHALEKGHGCIRIEKDRRGEMIGVWMKWHQVDAFNENAHQANEGRIYTLDLELGRLMFGDGKIGRIPHSDQADFIRVQYALGGGLAGNLGAGKVNKAVNSLPFLERVYNGSPVWGGLGIESTLRAQARTSEHIRHRGLALSHRDIEGIIASKNRDIHDVHVTSKKGQIYMSILPDAFPYQISQFYEIKDKAEKTLRERAPMMVTDQHRLHIKEPLRITFSVNMDVVVESAGDYIKALSRWHTQLDNYFHPLYGGPKKRGWKIGSLPEHSSILADLKHMLVGTELIDNVMIQMHLIDGDKRIPVSHRTTGDIDLSHAIPVSGMHDVRIRISKH